MPLREGVTVTVSGEAAKLMRDKLASGAYASEGDVILASLHALQERDGEYEIWLRRDVLPTYDAHVVDPSATASLQEATQRLSRHMGDERP